MNDAAYCSMIKCWEVLADPIFWKVLVGFGVFVIGMSIWANWGGSDET